jgi:hypothetical protein
LKTGQPPSKPTKLLKSVSEDTERGDSATDLERPLLASTLQDINLQLSSPLFARLPKEIRDMIFRFTIIESIHTTSSEGLLHPRKGSKVYHQNTNHIPKRPGSVGITKVCLSLLLSCRRIYLETHHLPIQLKEHIFYRPCFIGPPSLLSSLSVEKYLQRFGPQQLQFLSDIHVVAHQLFLEDGSFMAMCRLKDMQGIQKLKITMRYCDWWDWERNLKMEMNPWGKSIELGRMVGTRKVDLAQWKEHVWGCAFQELASLREVEIELETSEDRRQELETIVCQAQRWEFPMTGGRVLTTQGLLVRRSCWEGPICAWSRLCPGCSGTSEDRDKCLDRRVRTSASLGLILHIAVLRWRVKYLIEHI